MAQDEEPKRAALASLKTRKVKRNPDRQLHRTAYDIFLHFHLSRFPVQEYRWFILPLLFKPGDENSAHALGILTDVG